MLARSSVRLRSFEMQYARLFNFRNKNARIWGIENKEKTNKIRYMIQPLSQLDVQKSKQNICSVLSSVFAGQDRTLEFEIL